MGAATFEAYERDRQNQIKADALAKEKAEKEEAAKERKARRNARVKPDVEENTEE